MSALLPMEMALDTPSSRSSAMSIMAVHSAPDWEKMAMLPAWGMRRENEAFMRMAVLITPRQLGPSSRTPPRRQMAISSSSRARPSEPASLKPEATTTTAPAFLATASLAAAGTISAGTAITTRSIASG